MMRSEFEEVCMAIDAEYPKPTASEYEMIVHVYAWHPAIKCKSDIAKLYVCFGMSVILDMEETAVYMEHMDDKRREILNQIDALRERLHDLDDEERDYLYIDRGVIR